MKGKSPATKQGIGETLKGLTFDLAKDTAKDIKDAFLGGFEQIVSSQSKERSHQKPEIEKQVEKKTFKPQAEGILFKYRTDREPLVVKRRIEELLKMIREEVKALKNTTESITREVQEAEKLTLEKLPEKVGVYHVRFLEVVLKLLRALRSKASESKTWLEALMTRRKKRGSLFLALSKKKGTQYSLSNELKVARQTQ